MGIRRGRGPAEQEERSLEAAGLEHFCEILRLRLRQQVHLDADARQHADDGLADQGVVDVAVVRAIHRHFEAVGIAGLRQQLLGTLGVRLLPREVPGQCEQLRRDHQHRWRRQPAHHPRLDQVDVDGLVEGFADADILERVLALDVGEQQLVPRRVEAEEDGAQLRAGQHFGIAARVDARDILDRNRLDHVDFARQQGGDARRGGGDRREHDFLQIVFGLAPPVRIRLEHRLDAWLMAFDHEGAGAVLVQRGVARRGRRSRRRRDGVVLLAPLLVHDVPVVPLRGQDGIRCAQRNVDRVVVDLGEFRIGRHVGQEVRPLRAHALGREDDVSGGEGIAVVEFDVLAQVKAPAGRLRRFPAFRQRRNDLEVLVARHQALIDVAVMGDGRAFLQRIGIEGFEVALVGVAQRLARCGRSQQSDRGKNGR